MVCCRYESALRASFRSDLRTCPSMCVTEMVLIVGFYRCLRVYVLTGFTVKVCSLLYSVMGRSCLRNVQASTSREPYLARSIFVRWGVT